MIFVDIRFAHGTHIYIQEKFAKEPNKHSRLNLLLYVWRQGGMSECDILGYRRPTDSLLIGDSCLPS